MYTSDEMNLVTYNVFAQGAYFNPNQSSFSFLSQQIMKRDTYLILAHFMVLDIEIIF